MKILARFLSARLMHPAFLILFLQFLELGMGLGTLSSCTRTIERVREIEVPKEVPSEPPTRIITGEESMDADSLVELGEQLFSAETLMLSKKCFEWALVKNPNNLKAQFYSRLLERFMVFKGIGPRLRPWFKRSSSLTAWDSLIKGIKSKPARTFVMASGGTPISNLRDFQNLLHLYVEKIIAFREFLLKNSDLELTLHLRSDVLQSFTGKQETSPCQIISQSDGKFEVRCNENLSGELRITPADVVALRQYLAGEILAISLYFTSYDLNGYEKFQEETRSHNWSVQQQLAYLNRELPDLGKLRHDHQLGILPSLGSDLVAATQWALNHQPSLCPQSKGWGPRRPHYLFYDGICIEDNDHISKSIALLDRAMKEPFIFIDTNVQSRANGGPDKVKVSFQPLFSKPPQHLRQFFPKTFDSCGAPLSWYDPTFGGFLPDLNAEMLSQIKPYCPERN